MNETCALLYRHGNVPLWLGGWDRGSYWGWRQAEQSLFAALYKNEDDRMGAPRARVGRPDSSGTDSPENLALMISEVTGCSVHDALLAMAKSAPEQVRDQLTALAAA